MVCLVLVCSGERTARRGQGQAALSYALEREQAVGEFPQVGRRAAENQHFEALVPVEMDMSRGNDLGKGIVLHLHQAPRQLRLVVPVDV